MKEKELFDMERIFLSLGSNLGDREENLNQALELLKTKINILKVSSVYETEPVGYKDQNWFFNMVVEGITELDMKELLSFTQSIEKDMKRVKTIVNGPRIIDIDILIYGDSSINTESLIIPHPRIKERAFVLVPLAEIAPGLILNGEIIEDVLKRNNTEKIFKRFSDMERLNGIIKDEVYFGYLERIKKLEADRIYCRHDMIHFLEVAEKAYKMSMEAGIKIEKEIIYAIGMLHDIGRWVQYEQGIDHAEASADLAKDILCRYGFSEFEKDIILSAIRNHRNKKAEKDFDRLIYMADKSSRNCDDCLAKIKCKRFQSGV